MARLRRSGFFLLGPVVCFFLLSLGSANADTLGSVFVTGHDPDFHAQIGNTIGAQHIIQQGLSFVRNGNTAPILFLETDPTLNNALGDHVDSEPGLISSGYTASNAAGNHYVKVNATQFATANFSLYSAIFLPSDHGGSLTESDLAAVNARSAAIISYLNGGGGLMALAEDGAHSKPAVGPYQPLFAFLPFLVSSTALSQGEQDTLTPFGVSLGLTNTDINGNYSHNIFTATGGMNVVDYDQNGKIITLAYHGQISASGVVPEPGTIALFGSGLACLAGFLRKR